MANSLVVEKMQGHPHPKPLDTGKTRASSAGPSTGEPGEEKKAWSLRGWRKRGGILDDPLILPAVDRRDLDEFT